VVDEARILRLLRSISDDVSVLQRESGADESRRADPIWLRGVKYTFVTAIEACVDVAQHICATEGWGPRLGLPAALQLPGAKLCQHLASTTATQAPSATKTTSGRLAGSTTTSLRTSNLTALTYAPNLQIGAAQVTAGASVAPTHNGGYSRAPGMRPPPRRQACAASREPRWPRGSPRCPGRRATAPAPVRGTCVGPSPASRPSASAGTVPNATPCRVHRTAIYSRGSSGRVAV
jgi:hypothetical protein